VIDESHEEFVFDVSTEPVLVNFDATKVLLCEKTDQKHVDEWVHQYYRAPLYVDRYEAINKCGDYSRTDSAATSVVIDALDDKFFKLRNLAMRELKYVVEKNPILVKDKLVSIARSDPEPSSRATAVRKLANYFDEDKELIAVYKQTMKDSSMNVMGASLNAIAETDAKEGLKLAKALEEKANSSLLNTIARIYSKEGTDEQNDFFLTKYQDVTGFSKMGFLMSYERYLQKEERGEAEIVKAIPFYDDIALNAPVFYFKIFGVNGLKSIKKIYKRIEYELNNNLARVEKDDITKFNELNGEITKVVNLQNELEEKIKAANEQSDLNRVKIRTSTTEE